MTPEERAEALWRTRTHLPDVIIRNQADLDDIARTAAAIHEAGQEARTKIRLEAIEKIILLEEKFQAAITEAAERGREEMREMCAELSEGYSVGGVSLSSKIRALPTTEEKK